MRAALVAVPISFKLAPDTIDHCEHDADQRAVFHERQRANLCPVGLLRFDFEAPDGCRAMLDAGPLTPFEPTERAWHDLLDGIPLPATWLGYRCRAALASLREGPNALQGVPYMKSPLGMQGDDKHTQKTAEVNADGRYRSGAIAQSEAFGFFNFPGRSEGLFVVGGKNVRLDEVKRLVESGLRVHHATVVPACDKIKGKLPFGCVVRQADRRRVARRHPGLALSGLGWQLASGAAPHALCPHRLYRHALRTGTACDAGVRRCARSRTAQGSEE